MGCNGYSPAHRPISPGRNGYPPHRTATHQVRAIQPPHQRPQRPRPGTATGVLTCPVTVNRHTGTAARDTSAQPLYGAHHEDPAEVRTGTRPHHHLGRHPWRGLLCRRRLQLSAHRRGRRLTACGRGADGPGRAPTHPPSSAARVRASPSAPSIERTWSAPSPPSDGESLRLFSMAVPVAERMAR